MNTLTTQYTFYYFFQEIEDNILLLINQKIDSETIVLKILLLTRELEKSGLDSEIIIIQNGKEGAIMIPNNFKEKFTRCLNSLIDNCLDYPPIMPGRKKKGPKYYQKNLNKIFQKLFKLKLILYYQLLMIIMGKLIKRAS